MWKLGGVELEVVHEPAVVVERLHAARSGPGSAAARSGTRVASLAHGQRQPEQQRRQHGHRRRGDRHPDEPVAAARDVVRVARQVVARGGRSRSPARSPVSHWRTTAVAGRLRHADERLVGGERDAVGEPEPVEQHRRPCRRGRAAGAARCGCPRRGRPATARQRVHRGGVGEEDRAVLRHRRVVADDDAADRPTSVAAASRRRPSDRVQGEQPAVGVADQEPAVGEQLEAQRSSSRCGRPAVRASPSRATAQTDAVLGAGVDACRPRDDDVLGSRDRGPGRRCSGSRADGHAVATARTRHSRATKRRPRRASSTSPTARRSASSRASSACQVVDRPLDRVGVGHVTQQPPRASLSPRAHRGLAGLDVQRWRSGRAPRRGGAAPGSRGTPAGRGRAARRRRCAPSPGTRRPDPGRPPGRGHGTGHPPRVAHVRTPVRSRHPLPCVPVTASNSKARSRRARPARHGARHRRRTTSRRSAPLGASDLDRLTGIVTGALERDEQRVAAALEGTVRFVPRPLRGRARKMLFPEDEPSGRAVAAPGAASSWSSWPTTSTSTSRSSRSWPRCRPTSCATCAPG